MTSLHCRDSEVSQERWLAKWKKNA